MAHAEVERSVWVDGDVARDGHALLEDGRLQVELLHQVRDVHTDLDENKICQSIVMKPTFFWSYLSHLRSEWRPGGGHLRWDVGEHLAAVIHLLDHLAHVAGLVHCEVGVEQTQKFISHLLPSPK